MVMDKTNIYKNLHNRYPQSVIAPENPFTIDNPDALIFNGRVLIGLFIPKVKEVNNPDLLLRRLYISRLSLCYTLCSILLLSGEEAVKLSNNPQISTAFDAVKIYEDTGDLLHFLQDNFKPIHFIQPRLRRERLRRFWGIMSYIEKVGIEKSDYDELLGGRKEYHVQSWSNPEKTYYSRNASFIFPYLMASRSETKQSFRDGYDRLMTYTTMFNYSLDDGVLKANAVATDSFMFLNVENLDYLMKNPLYLKSMAFLGYVPGRIGRDYNVSSFRDRYWKFMKEYKYL